MAVEATPKPRRLNPINTLSVSDQIFNFNSTSTLINSICRDLMMNCARVSPYNNNKKRCVDQLYSSQFQQHRFGLGIDHIISQHTKRMRLEIRERQIHQAKLLVSAIGKRATKELEEKDDHIRSLCKLNSALGEKVKSLLVENQVWRELAHANEAAANSLRANLHQLLLQPLQQVEEDVESCCGSSNDDDGTTAEIIYESSRMMRRCRTCRERESCVLVLPCRHLCLCSVCGSGPQLQACPVCNAAVKATLHVNMSMT